MPWESRRRNGKFQVVKKGTNQVVGTHADKEGANNQVKALYANYHGPKPGEKRNYSGAIARRRKNMKSKTSAY